MLDEAKKLWSAQQWQDYRKENLEGYLNWYWNTGIKLEAWSRWLRRASICFGLLATSAAAFPATDLNLDEPSKAILKWAVVVLTALVTSAAAAQSRIAQAARAREAGRVTITELESSLRIAMLYEAMTDEERARRLAALPPLIAAAERQFGSDPNSSVERSVSS